MRYSRHAFLLGLIPVSAWAANTLGLGLQAHECRDIPVYFKLLLWGPVVEELVFRAGIQTWLTRNTGHAFLANCTTSFLFGLAHYAFSTHIASWLVVLPSMVLGWVYTTTNSIALVIALHAIFNFSFITVMCLHM
jgi:membrane protease YdiL (CAAX protease family)